MFLGEYDYRIDEKGRVAIPAKFREPFKEGLVLSRGFDKCIIVYPLSEWTKVAQRLTTLPMTRSKSRRINRATFSTAFSSELDRQGRVILPPALRQYAGIKDGVVIAGLYEYLEIWSHELWAAERALMDEQAWQLAEGLEVRP